MRRFALPAVVVLVAAVAAALWWSGRAGREAGDDYDYAAAFESLDPASRAPLFRIAEVAGRPEAEVAAVLGPPWQCESSRYSRRCRYAPGATEVVYIDGKADWLTVTALGDAPLDDQLLMRIGLQPAPAGTASDQERVWLTLGGLREVRAYGTPDRAQFLRIKVKS
jgi:hypothetical protein